MTKNGTFYILSSFLYSLLLLSKKNESLFSKIIKVSQEFRKMSPFPVFLFPIETSSSRNLSKPQVSPYLPIALMPNPLEILLISFQSLIYFFIQQVFPVYAQVVSIVLEPGCTTIMGWGGV